MISYSIAPSVFQPPNISFISNSNHASLDEKINFHKQIIFFYENINKIRELINNEELMVLVFNFTKMSFDDDYMKKANCLSELPIDQLKKILDKLQSYYFPDPFSNKEKGIKKKYYTFEDWYKFERLKYENIEFQPSLNRIKDSSYDNEEAVVKIGLINNYLYKNIKFHFLLDKEEITYKYVCKRINLTINKIPKNEKSLISEVQIKQLIKINCNNKQKFISVSESYKKARELFSDYIIFGKDVERGIYTIQDDAGPPDRIFAYLQTLKEFTEYKKNNKTDFSDDYILTALGCDCSYERPKHMQDEKVINDRMFDNGNNEKIPFNLHLKPSTNNLYLYGTVRIYISWDNNQQKVIVGWIGRHLYLPPRTP
jgi:hypothetical protein